MPPKQPKRWAPVAKLTLLSRNGRVVTISTVGTVPGKIGNNKRTAATSQLASWELFFGDGQQLGGFGQPPAEFTHLYSSTVINATIRLNVVDVNTLTGTATLTITGLAGPPDPPQVLTATVLSSSSIRLDWTDPGLTATSFTVERRLAGVGSFAVIATVTAPAVIYTDTGLTAATAYEYRVQAFNGNGSSAYSNTAAATTNPSVPPVTPPTAPSALTITGSSVSAVSLGWTDNSSNEAGFKIERNTGGGAFSEIATVQAGEVAYTDSTVSASTTYSYRVRAFNAAGNSAYTNTAGVTTPAPPLPTAPSNLVAVALTPTSVQLTWTDNATTETGFELERRIGSQAFVRIITLASNLTSYVDASASPATVYTYRIRAINANGNSAYAPAPQVTTPSAPPPNPPIVVLNASATSITQGQSITWSTVGTMAGSGSLATWIFNRGNSTTQNGTGTPPLTLGPYTYPAVGIFTATLSVTDTNGITRTASSQPVTVSAAPSPPTAPTNLLATLSAPTSVQLNWTDTSTNETGFSIERRIPSGSFAQITTVGPNIGGYLDTGLNNNTTYEYRVRAFNGVGNSAYSNTVSIMTQIIVGASTKFWAVGGSNGANGDIDHPWATPQFGMSQVGAGDTLYGRNGTYNMRIDSNAGVINPGTSWNNTVKVAGYSNEVVTLAPTSGVFGIYFGGAQRFIEFENLRLNGRSGITGDIIKLEAFQTNAYPKNIRVRGCDLNGPANGSGGQGTNAPHAINVQRVISVEDAAGYNEFLNNTYHDGGDTGDASYALYITSNGNLVNGGDVARMRTEGVQIFAGGDSDPLQRPTGNTVCNLTIHDILAGAAGLSCSGLIDYGQNNTYFNLVIYNIRPGGGLQGNGIERAQWSGGKGYNLTITNCDVGLNFAFTSNNQVWNTISFGNSLNADFGGTSVDQQNNLFGINPLFVNPGANNYQLQAGSPAIDTGRTIAVVPTDILGVFRPQGSAYDIGAYERPV